MTEVIEKNGLRWPATDEICYDVILKDVPFLHEAIALCEEKRTAVQAGGNAGMYPLEIAKHFDQVLTFEPEILNFECLVANTKTVPNITVVYGLLGDCHQLMGISGWKPNCGSYEVTGTGDIPQSMISDFNLKDLDFIQLDVQGYEGKVLQGGRETMERCKPVIMLEEGYGQTPRHFLQEMGYEEAIATRPINKSGVRDAVYVCKT